MRVCEIYTHMYTDLCTCVDRHTYIHAHTFKMSEQSIAHECNNFVLVATSCPTFATPWTVAH